MNAIASLESRSKSFWAMIGVVLIALVGLLDFKTGYELDFIHLNLNKKQGKLGLTLHDEVVYASPASRIYHNPCSF